MFTQADLYRSQCIVFCWHAFHSISVLQPLNKPSMLCAICILWHSEWSFMPWSYIQRLFTFSPKSPSLLQTFPFPPNIQVKKNFFLDFSHSFPMSNLSHLFLFVRLWKSSLSLVQPLLLRPIHYDRLCLDLQSLVHVIHFVISNITPLTSFAT